jgi:hypothetical protein
MKFKGYGRAHEWLMWCLVLLMCLVLWISHTYWNLHIDQRTRFGNIIFRSNLTEVVDIEEGEIHEVCMSFLYTGNTTAKVLEVKTGGDCGCTKLEVSALDLFPNENYTLSLTYDSHGQSEGMKETKVFIRIAEEGKEQIVDFSLPLRVHRRIILSPQTVNLGEIGASTMIDKTIQIKIVGDYDCRKIKAVSSVDTLRAEIIPLSRQQRGQTEDFVFADLRITGSIPPKGDRIKEYISLTLPNFSGNFKNLDKYLSVQLYGMAETRMRIVPATLFLSFLEIGTKKDIDFIIITCSGSSVEILDIRCDDKGVFTKSNEVKQPDGRIHVSGSVVLNEKAVHDTSLNLTVVFRLDGEEIKQELPCVYLINKEEL